MAKRYPLDGPNQEWHAGYAAGLASGKKKERRALENIRLVAAKGLSFGNQPTPQTLEKMVMRKELALKMVLGYCAKAGVDSSPLRNRAKRKSP